MYIYIVYLYIYIYLFICIYTCSSWAMPGTFARSPAAAWRWELLHLGLEIYSDGKTHGSLYAFILGGSRSTKDPNMTSMRGFGGSSVLRLATIASVADTEQRRHQQLNSSLWVPRLEIHRHGVQQPD